MSVCFGICDSRGTERSLQQGGGHLPRQMPGRWRKTMEVRAATLSDALEWERMRQKLWPSVPGEHATDIASFFGGTRICPLEVLIARDAAGVALGFAEVSLRSIADGCASSPVAYLEGWFVEEAARRAGVGSALVIAVEEWARKHGCTELASDTEIGNTVGHAAHQAVGFEETGLVTCFRKSIPLRHGAKSLEAP